VHLISLAEIEPDAKSTLIETSGEWVGLLAILDLRVSQYGARIFELRKLGFRIKNKTEMKNGIRHSWFRLVGGLQALPAQPVLQSPGSQPIPMGLFHQDQVHHDE